VSYGNGKRLLPASRRAIRKNYRIDADSRIWVSKANGCAIKNPFSTKSHSADNNFLRQTMDRANLGECDGAQGSGGGALRRTFRLCGQDSLWVSGTNGIPLAESNFNVEQNEIPCVYHKPRNEALFFGCITHRQRVRALCRIG
jgi:hypothetical protein